MIECTINILCKDRTFRFGMGAWEKFCQIQGCEFHEMYRSGIIPINEDKDNGIEAVKWNIFVFKNLLFAAYFNACQAKKQACDITIEDVVVWMDELANEDYQLIFETITSGLELVKNGKKKESQNPPSE